MNFDELDKMGVDFTLTTRRTIKTADVQKGDFLVGYRKTVASVAEWAFGQYGEIKVTFEDGSNIVTQRGWEMTVIRGR